jgi:photosystem II cytochrome c550
MLQSIHRLVSLLLVLGGLFLLGQPAQAANIDPYVRRYLKATEAVPITMDAEGHTQMFTPQALTEGKQLFEENCINCHVGGTTLSNPLESLALKVLEGATPSRNNVASLTAFQREPLTYDGSDISFGCREVPDSWLSDEMLTQLAAFVLRAAETAPGWGAQDF